MDQMITKNEIKDLLKPSLWRWGIRVVWNWLEITTLFVMCWYLDKWWAYALAIPLLGTRQHAISILGHDGAHYSACQNRFFNDCFTQLFTFWPLATGLDGYRKFHFMHHRATGEAYDPELIFKKLAKSEWELPMPRRRIVGFTILDMLGFAIIDIIRLNLMIKRISFRDVFGPLVLWTIISIFLFKSHLLWALALWWFSMVSSFWASFRIRVWGEHVGVKDTHRIHMNLLQRFFFGPHNVWMHYEHHKWPSMPFYNLPRARKLIPTKPIIHFGELIMSYAYYPKRPEEEFATKYQSDRKIG